MLRFAVLFVAVALAASAQEPMFHPIGECATPPDAVKESTALVKSSKYRVPGSSEIRRQIDFFTEHAKLGEQEKMALSCIYQY
ncbi:MAG: hypothetical protein OXB98_06660 [Bryobacterales bacterium]|nr:hypothetical protein [Bryobacterales bacterium]